MRWNGKNQFASSFISLPLENYIYSKDMQVLVYILFITDPTVGFSGYLMNTYEVDLSNKELETQLTVTK